MRVTVRAFLIATLALTGAAVRAPAAPADQPPEDVKPVLVVNAEGNFTGGLRFLPSQATVRPGDFVRWTNTDPLVPHTATEDHDLFDLTGDYGGTPANPPGFAPGESRDWQFAAGSFDYFCRVHPVEMRGVIDAPVTLLVEKRKVKVKSKRKSKKRGTKKRSKRRVSSSAKRAKGKRRAKKRPAAKTRTLFRVRAVWAASELPEGQVADVQRRGASGGWKTVRDGTRDLNGVFAGGKKGTLWQFRARVRRADDPTRASGWAGAARVTVG